MKLSHSTIIIVATFVISRILFFLAGVCFDTTTLTNGIQLIDPILLKTKLLESVFYLHSQPPLFNVFVGVIIKLFPDNFAVVFHGLFLLVGVSIAFGFFYILEIFRVDRRVGTFLTCFFIINPACILYENWLMYTYFILAVMCWLVVFLYRYMTLSRTRDGVIFFSLCALLVLTKSTFHMVWYVFILMVLLIVLRTKRKNVICVSIIPLLIICSLYMKNYVLFGTFTTSKSWMAFNLLEMSAKNVDPDTVEQLFVSGKIQMYEEQASRKTGIDLLDQVKKPTSKDHNWNSQLALDNAKVDMVNSKFFLKHYPESYYKSIARAYQMYFYPGPTDVTFKNRRKMELYENIYNFMFYRLNAINDYSLYSDKLLLWYEFDRIKWDGWSLNCYSAVVLFYIGLFIMGFYIIVRGMLDKSLDTVQIVLMLFMLFNIFYISVGSNFFAWIGPNRYRFVVEPYYLTVFAICLMRLCRKHGSKEGTQVD